MRRDRQLQMPADIIRVFISAYLVAQVSRTFGFEDCFDGWPIVRSVYARYVDILTTARRNFYVALPRLELGGFNQIITNPALVA